MKKILCLLLAMIMVFGLCGCFADDISDEDVRGKIIREDDDENEKKNNKKDQDEDEDLENKKDDEKNEDEAVKAPAFSFGKTSRNTYKNDFLGLSCTLPSEWDFYTDEQILELNNIVVGYYDEDVAELIENASIIYDMYANDTTTGDNINMNLQKLTAFQIANLDMKQNVESQFDGIRSTYQNMGFPIEELYYDEIRVDGEQFDGLRLVASTQGVNMYITAFCFVKGNYLVTVTVGSVGRDITDAILNYFTFE